MRAGSRDDGGSGIEEFAKGGSPGEREVESEVFGGEDEAGEIGRRSTDGGQVDEGFCGFDESDEAEGLLLILRGRR